MKVTFALNNGKVLAPSRPGASTPAKAQELGLYGYVKNQPDSSVYIEVYGAT